MSTVICTFHGCGKSDYVKDLNQRRKELQIGKESTPVPQPWQLYSVYSLGEGGFFASDEKEWYEHYVDELEHLMKIYSIVFVSAHRSIRDELVRRNIPFALVYPMRSALDVYIERYKAHGMSEERCNKTKHYWPRSIKDLYEETRCKTSVILPNSSITPHFPITYINDALVMHILERMHDIRR